MYLMAENIDTQSLLQHLDFRTEGTPHKSPSKRGQLKHIDFTTLKKNKTPMAPRKSNVIVTDLQEDRDSQGNVKGAEQTRSEMAEHIETQRLQLISPPPEEVLQLRRVSGGVSTSLSLSLHIADVF